jgi:hypothetical protein
MQHEAREAALLQSSVSCRPLSWTDNRSQVGLPKHYSVVFDRLDDDDEMMMNCPGKRFPVGLPT